MYFVFSNFPGHLPVPYCGRPTRPAVLWY